MISTLLLTTQGWTREVGRVLYTASVSSFLVLGIVMGDTPSDLEKNVEINFAGF